MFTVCKS